MIVNRVNVIVLTLSIIWSWLSFSIASAENYYERVRIVGVNYIEADINKIQVHLIYKEELYHTDLTLTMLNDICGLLLENIETLVLLSSDTLNTLLPNDTPLNIPDSISGSQLLYIKAINIYEKHIYRELRFWVNTKDHDSDFELSSHQSLESFSVFSKVVSLKIYTAESGNDVVLTSKIKHPKSNQRALLCRDDQELLNKEEEEDKAFLKERNVVKIKN